MANNGIPLNIVLKYLQSPTMEKDIRDIGGKAGLELKRVFGEIFNVALPAATLGGLSKLTNDYAKEIKKLSISSRELGISTKELDKWTGAVSMVGVQKDTFVGTMKSLRHAIVDISRGGRGGLWEEMIRGWQPGDIQRFRKTGPIAYLEEIVKHVEKLKKRGVSEADLMMSLDKIGITDQNLKDLILGGTQNLDKLLEESKRLGIIEKEDEEKARKLFDTLQKTKRVIDVGFRTTFRDLGEVITFLAGAFNKLAGSHPEILGRVLEGAAVAGSIWSIKKLFNFGKAIGNINKIGGAISQGGVVAGDAFDKIMGTTVKRMNVTAGVVKINGATTGGLLGGGNGSLPTAAGAGALGAGAIAAGALTVAAVTVYSAAQKLEMVGWDGKGLKEWLQNSDSGNMVADKILETIQDTSQETQEAIKAIMPEYAKKAEAEKNNSSIIGDDDFVRGDNIHETVIINGIGWSPKEADEFLKKNTQRIQEQVKIKQKASTYGSTTSVQG